MARPKQGAQQMRKLLSQDSHVVTVGLEQLEQGAKMRRRKGQVAAVIGRIPVHELMHAATDVLLIQRSLKGMAMQALTSLRLHEVRRG